MHRTVSQDQQRHLTAPAAGWPRMPLWTVIILSWPLAAVVRLLGWQRTAWVDATGIGWIMLCAAALLAERMIRQRRGQQLWRETGGRMDGTLRIRAAANMPADDLDRLAADLEAVTATSERTKALLGEVTRWLRNAYEADGLSVPEGLTETCDLPADERMLWLAASNGETVQALAPSSPAEPPAPTAPEPSGAAQPRTASAPAARRPAARVRRLRLPDSRRILAAAAVLSAAGLLWIVADQGAASLSSPPARAAAAPPPPVSSPRPPQAVSPPAIPATSGTRHPASRSVTIPGGQHRPRPAPSPSPVPSPSPSAVSVSGSTCVEVGQLKVCAPLNVRL
jgi:hypothetical protein